MTRDIAAARVYRPWSLRTLRNDGAYRQGRADLDDDAHQMIDDGMLHAIEEKTEYGRQLLHRSWIAFEFQSLRTLHAAGAAVPEPYGIGAQCDPDEVCRRQAELCSVAGRGEPGASRIQGAL